MVHNTAGAHTHTHTNKVRRDTLPNTVILLTGCTGSDHLPLVFPSSQSSAQSAVVALWPWVVETKGIGPPSPVDCVPVPCVCVGGGWGGGVGECGVP